MALVDVDDDDSVSLRLDASLESDSQSVKTMIECVLLCSGLSYMYITQFSHVEVDRGKCGVRW